MIPKSTDQEFHCGVTAKYSDFSLMINTQLDLNSIIALTQQRQHIEESIFEGLLFDNCTVFYLGNCRPNHTHESQCCE
ncbi:hypothetical protein ASF27_14725 [Methylobacterium sp. Leaf102]|nr:hypothetical protein ASF27_14725 [Methylobacterium sp. Leaf102]